MKKVEVELGTGRKVVLKELMFMDDFDALSATAKEKPSAADLRQLLEHSIVMTTEERTNFEIFLKELTMADAIKLMQEITELNGLKQPEDFTKSNV